MSKMEDEKKVSARILVKKVFKGKRLEFRAQTQNQFTYHNKELFSSQIIGYAEFPPRTHVPAKDNLEDFKEMVEEMSEYTHWK